MAELYRKSAMDRLSSPEQLDKMITIISPSFWIAAIGGGLIISVVIIWSVAVRLPITLSVDGIFMDPEDMTGNWITCYVPIADGRKIEEGMQVMVYPSTAARQEYGHMAGEVTYVENYVTPQEDMLEQLGDQSLVSLFSGYGPVVAVDIELKTDENTKSGFWWSSRKGKTVRLADGTPVNCDIVIDSKAPITMVIPSLKDTLTVKQAGN